MNKAKNIVALGDSITYGYPYTPKASWENILDKKMNIKIINKGINGDTLEGMLERFDQDVKSFTPKFMIVMGGTNDAFNDASVDSMKYNLKQIIERAINSGIIPIVGMTIPVDEPVIEQKLIKYRDFIKDFCKKNDILIIDFFSVMVDDRGRIKQALDFDGVHPNREGYRVMGQEAQRTMQGKHSEQIWL